MLFYILDNKDKFFMYSRIRTNIIRILLITNIFFINVINIILRILLSNIFFEQTEILEQNKLRTILKFQNN